MKIEALDCFIEEILEKSTMEVPVWNVEYLRGSRKEERRAGWNYVDGCMILALLELYDESKDSRYYDFADGFIDCRVKEDGSIEGYRPDEYNIDNVNAGKTLFLLYEYSGREKYRKAIELIYSQLKNQPRTEEGNFWHKLIYPNQVWLDGLYMAMPFYMEYETKWNRRRNYPDIFRQFETVVTHMRDEKTGLYYHGYDASRQVFWCDKETGLSANFWLRALGWFSMALLDTLCKCKTEPGYETQTQWLKNVFQQLMEDMLRYQSDSGMWYQLPALYAEGNYPETSGSAILSYCFLKGVRMGLLPGKYLAAGKKAFAGICDTYLREKEGGGIHLGGICLVAGLGPQDNKRRDGTSAYYLSEPVTEDDAKGVGPFLLAYSEMKRLTKQKDAPAIF